MNKRIFAILVLIPFSVLTACSLLESGYIGLFTGQMESVAGWQVLIDLVIALTLVLSWLIPEAKRAGRNPWPFVVITLLGGSFGPLLYLVTAKTEEAK